MKGNADLSLTANTGSHKSQAITNHNSSEQAFSRFDAIIKEQNDKFSSMLLKTKEDMQKKYDEQFSSLSESIKSLKEKKQKQCELIDRFVSEKAKSVNKQENLALLLLNTCKEIVSGNPNALINTVQRLRPEGEMINANFEKEITTLAATLSE